MAQINQTGAGRRPEREGTLAQRDTAGEPCRSAKPDPGTREAIRGGTQKRSGRALRVMNAGRATTKRQRVRPEMSVVKYRGIV